MKKIKYPILGVVLITLILSTTGSLGSPIVDTKNTEIFWINPVSMGPVLEVTTDKTVYSVGEKITTFLTNVGDDTLSAGGPIITIYNEQEEIVYQEGTYCWHELESGEFIEWLPWDQTNQQGQQVPIGEYIVEGFLSGVGENYVDDATFYISNRGDELDQYQLDMDWFGPVGVFMLNPYNYILSQSFIPTKNILTRVELMVGKNATTTYDYTVAIRDDLNGLDITSVNVPAANVQIENFSWIEFDFPDTEVTIGNTYYIVSYTVNETDNWYAWGLKTGDVYLNGTIYFTTNDGATWEEEPDGDMTFKTYGRSNSPPSITSISGEKNGKINVEYEYTFNATDPDGDDVKYFIDWGDNNTEWTGYNLSGTDVKVKHTWSEKGTYNITAKAQDIYSAEGPEGTLDITMPKNKSPILNFPILNWLFERFPNAFPILRQLLRL